MTKYDLPKEIYSLIQKAEAMATLRDLYVKLPFCYKKAKKAAIEHESYRVKFWYKVQELYPDLKGKKIAYNSSGFFVWDQDEK